MNPGDAAAALQLRDIHLPPAPSWWPPAPGWWLLALLTVAVLWWVAGRPRRRWRQRRARRQLIEQLAAVQQAHPVEREPAAALAAASELLRRACRRYAPDAVALTGDAWLAFLDRGLADQPFSAGPGRLLLDGPFRPSVPVEDAREVLALVARRLPRLVDGGR